MKKIIVLLMALILVLSLSACKETDVVAKVAGTSFNAVLNITSVSIKYDDTYKGWALASPTGERFIWSSDFSNEGSPDATLEFDAKPFLDAGLDVTKLPAHLIVVGDKIVFQPELGADKFTYSGEATPLASFKEIIKTNRDIVGYHEKLDHYGIALGEGNMFEWAKDMKTNDKDIVFVLNPQPFIDAGVNPNAVAGWFFAKVKVKDDNGKKIEVDKLLKPFDLD